MESITKSFRNIQAFSLIIGMAFGAAVAISLFSYLVPGGEKMIALYHNKIASVKAEKNKEEMAKLYATTTPVVSKNPAASHSAANHYMMAKVTSESQFLKEMKLHHEAAVTMSEQVLILPNIRPEVRQLAKNIINAQNTEIKMMKDWITAWKY